MSTYTLNIVFYKGYGRHKACVHLFLVCMNDDDWAYYIYTVRQADKWKGKDDENGGERKQWMKGDG